MNNEEQKDADRDNRERWLNGWHRSGTSVFIGTGAHCAGCGAFLGLICAAFDGTPWPEKEPDFPFEEATCPLCQLRRIPDPPGAVDKLTERLERLRQRDSVAVEEEREACAQIPHAEAAAPTGYEIALPPGVVPGPSFGAFAEGYKRAAIYIECQIRARSADKGRE